MAAAGNDRIVVGFRWEGPTECDATAAIGTRVVNNVKLVFKNTKTGNDFKVQLPERPSGPLFFTCSHYRATKEELGRKQCRVFDRETHSEEVRMTVEQARQLRLNIGVNLEESDIKPQQSCKPTLPDELEIGQKYILVVTSDGHRLGARFIKEEDPMDRIELVRFLEMGVSFPLDTHIEQFRELCSFNGIRLKKEAVSGAVLTEKIVATLKTDILQQLLVQIRGNLSEEKAFQLCLDTIGIETITEALRTELNALVPDMQASIDTFVENLERLLRDQ